MRRVTIYTASKPKHAAKWRALRRENFSVIATWIDYADDGAVTDWQKLWRDCAAEAAAANITTVYLERGEHLRGAYIEMGIAIANGRRVFLVNPHKVQVSDAVHHPLVTVFSTLDDAKAAIRRLEQQ